MTTFMAPFVNVALVFLSFHKKLALKHTKWTHRKKHAFTRLYLLFTFSTYTKIPFLRSRLFILLTQGFLNFRQSLSLLRIYYLKNTIQFHVKIISFEVSFNSPLTWYEINQYKLVFGHNTRKRWNIEYENKELITN